MRVRIDEISASGKTSKAEAAPEAKPRAKATTAAAADAPDEPDDAAAVVVPPPSTHMMRFGAKRDRATRVEAMVRASRCRYGWSVCFRTR